MKVLDLLFYFASGEEHWECELYYDMNKNEGEAIVISAEITAIVLKNAVAKLGPTFYLEEVYGEVRDYDQVTNGRGKLVASSLFPHFHWEIVWRKLSEGKGGKKHGK